jgi:hypothetical protein
MPGLPLSPTYLHEAVRIPEKSSSPDFFNDQSLDPSAFLARYAARAEPVTGRPACRCSRVATL